MFVRFAHSRVEFDQIKPRNVADVVLAAAWLALCLIQIHLMETARAAEPDTSFNRRPGVDWPQFLGPTGDNKSSETGLLPKWSEAGPPQVWRLDLATSYGMPTIADGRLFQFDRVGDKARVRCHDPATAKAIWTFDYPTSYEDLYGYNNGPRTSPVVAEGRVFVYGVEGMLHALSAKDGKLLWKVDTAEKFGVVQNFFGVGGTPVVEGELLIAMVGGSPSDGQKLAPGQVGRARPSGTAIVAFDVATGDVVYKLGDDLASYAGPTLATIDGRRWCFAFARETLIGFNPASGKLDFTFPWRAPILESVNASNPVVVGNRVFISETYGPGSALLQVKPGGFEVVWSDAKARREKALRTHWNTAVHHDGYLYGSSGRHQASAELRCIELATGAVMWSEPNLGRCSLLYADGNFVVLAEDGTLLLIEATPRRYELISRVELKANGERLLKAPAWAAPILSHGYLFVRGNDRLVCLDMLMK